VDRQKHWEFKRDAVYAVMQALGKADETLHFASVAEVESRKDTDPKRRLQAQFRSGVCEGVLVRSSRAWSYQK
jgi:hypothetical protein